MAVQSSVLAASFIFATGQEVLPIGGYTGTEPEPSVPDLAHMVANGDFHLVLAPVGSRLPQIVWIRQHCLRLNATKATAVIGPLRVFYCLAKRRRVVSRWPCRHFESVLWPLDGDRRVVGTKFGE